MKIETLLNKKYMPFYKWAHRGMKELPVFLGIYALLSALCADETNAVERTGAIEEICAAIAGELRRQGLSGSNGDFLLPHCDEIMQKISDLQIRSLHIMAE